VFTTGTTVDVNSAGNHDNRRCNPSFVGASASPPNYHLRVSDTCAKQAGDPARAPSTDFDGDSRPLGGAPADAGAEEIN
jgi:hypothetical protein